MSKSGLSNARLKRLHSAAKRAVEEGEAPGIITLVHRKGETEVDVVGRLAFEGEAKMERDSIFRIASMSKPITAVAAMILVEEGRLRLDEPVDGLLPELANRQVLKDPAGPLDATVPAYRPITMRDLLTFRLGLGMVIGPPGQLTPFQKAFDESRTMGLNFQTIPAPDPWMKALGALPLLHQPGEGWLYHTGSDVLGVLIARATGMSFEAFLKERIFEPLGMKDTGFHVPAKRLDRLTSCYEKSLQTGEMKVWDDRASSTWASPPPFASGGGGLVSTVDDYLAFGKMMLNFGRHGKERILSRPTVQAMVTDQLTPEQKARSPFFPGFWDNNGWGLGLGVITRRIGPGSNPGAFGWNGAFSTSWGSDPGEDLVGILLMQRSGFGAVAPTFHTDFWPLVYQAIDD
jgi:CubicO group peptidase (beta-lactamase class C family)